MDCFNTADTVVKDVRMLQHNQGLMFAVNVCRRRIELGEYCQLELFHAACASGHVVVMTSAVYGRMRLGRCVKQDYGFIGCSANVLRYADRLCSGRQTCQFPVAQLHGSQPCPDDLTPYLEASYQCVPGNWPSPPAFC